MSARRLHLWAIAAVLGLGGGARAESGRVNVHLEPALGFMLSAPQDEYFGFGFGTELKADVAILSLVAVQVSGSMVQFTTQTFTEPGRAYTAGLGVRLRLIDDQTGYAYHLGGASFHRGDFFGNLWLDLVGQAVWTGPLLRPGLEAAVGIELSIWDELQVGPFLKYQHIFQPNEPQTTPNDAYIFLAGVSGSFGLPSTAVHRQEASGFDADRDRDGTADPVDRCPDDPGPSFTNGCPDRDTDRDGLVDHVDQCPREPGPSFNQGCPEKDGDGDGMADRVDACPTEPGPAHARGCPVPDKDADGIPDAKDECPTEPETFNGVEDSDGCADGQSLAVVTETKIEIKRPLKFGQVQHKTGSWRVQRDSYLTLAAVARILFLRPELGKVWIEGHTDNLGGREDNERLSQNRAEAVRQHLIEVNGVEPDRLEARGFAYDCPIADNRAEAGRAKNRRVEFFIKPPPADGSCRAPSQR